MVELKDFLEMTKFPAWGPEGALVRGEEDGNREQELEINEDLM